MGKCKWNVFLPPHPKQISRKQWMRSNEHAWVCLRITSGGVLMLRNTVNPWPAAQKARNKRPATKWWSHSAMVSPTGLWTVKEQRTAGAYEDRESLVHLPHIPFLLFQPHIPTWLKISKTELGIKLQTQQALCSFLLPCFFFFFLSLPGIWTCDLEVQQPSCDHEGNSWEWEREIKKEPGPLMNIARLLLTFYCLLQIFFCSM